MAEYISPILWDKIKYTSFPCHETASYPMKATCNIKNRAILEFHWLFVYLNMTQFFAKRNWKKKAHFGTISPNLAVQLFHTCCRAVTHEIRVGVKTAP